MDAPERIHPQRLHKFLLCHVRKQRAAAYDTCVGEDDIQPPVALDGIIHDRLDGGLVCGVELARVHLAARVERLDLLLVVAQELVVKVTEVDGLGAVLGELVGCCPAYAQWGVCAWQRGQHECF